MAQKYSIIYDDVESVEHECQIYDDDYSGAIIAVQGRVFLDASKTNDPLEAIRGLGLRVELEADEDLTYEDLYSEEEKSFPVKYIRDSVTLFDGWLNPEGWYESSVADRWKVSFDCVDGLGYLENLSFVNTDGTQITGRKTQLEVIRLALLRTDLQNDSPEGITDDQARGEALRCLHCDCRKYDTCKLRIYAEKYQARPNRYKQTRPIFEQNLQHPDIIFEPGKCINCGLCVQIAAAAGEKPGLTFVGRGFDVRVRVPFNDSLKEALTQQTAAQCAAACPTGALALLPRSAQPHRNRV